MAQRGNQPGSLQKLRQQQQPVEPQTNNLNPPDWLDDEACKFWIRHAKNLTDSGLLTDGDLDSFALLARTWSALQQTDPCAKETATRYINLAKQYQALAKQFGLLPAERKRQALTYGDNLNRHDDKDEFDL